jgi:DNA invertase Pin-like site-specific DNA recombinase
MQTKVFGYVRVSSKDQNIDRQVNEMLAIGVNQRDILIDKQSGKDFDRPMYQTLKSHLREGDKLYIKSLDRFGRNKEKILKEWQEITKEIKADIVVLDMPLLDTTRYKNVSGLESLITDLVLQLLSYFAEEERDRIRTRQSEGVIAAKKNGKKFGRPNMEYPQDWDSCYSLWKQNKATAVETFNKLGLKKATFYKLVRKYENR